VANETERVEEVPSSQELKVPETPDLIHLMGTCPPTPRRFILSSGASVAGSFPPSLFSA
jgi:hypothetical protein